MDAGDLSLWDVSGAQNVDNKTQQEWKRFLLAAVLRSLGQILIGLTADEIEIRYNEFDGGVFDAIVRDTRIRFEGELRDGAWAFFILQEPDTLPEFYEDIRRAWLSAPQANWFSS